MHLSSLLLGETKAIVCNVDLRTNAVRVCDKLGDAVERILSNACKANAFEDVRHLRKCGHRLPIFR